LKVHVTEWRRGNQPSSWLTRLPLTSGAGPAINGQLNAGGEGSGNEEGIVDQAYV